MHTALEEGEDIIIMDGIERDWSDEVGTGYLYEKKRMAVQRRTSDQRAAMAVLY